MKGTIAGILLTAGFLFRIILTAMTGAIRANTPESALMGIDFVNLISLILWMSGSFLLAVHLRLDFLWGFAGLLFVFGLILMYFASPERKERRQRQKYPFDDPNYGEKGKRRKHRREQDDKPRTYDY